METSADTVIRVEGRAGRITLNRPKALNALAYHQIGEIRAALEMFASDDAVDLVILDGAGERGLCAGGDVRELYAARETDPGLAARFWRDEYVLNAMIHRYPKPYVAIMDGLVMGGGIGLSAHASHRIVTERSQLAMPETTIGLIPDVGGTWLLANAPGRMGELLGLFGTRMGAADALYAGFADTHVATAQLPALLAELVDPAGEPVGATIAEYATAPARAVLAPRQAEIDRLFASETIEDIAAAVSASEAPDWARELVPEIAMRSPLALKLTLAAIRNARHLGALEEALTIEFRLTTRLFSGGEFVEGVRALLVDKDRAPKWQPDGLTGVTGELVAAYFSPLSDPPDLGLLAPAA